MAVGMLGWRRLIPVLLTLSSVVTVDLSPGDLSVSMERTVDISTQVVKVTVKYELANVGSREVNSFVHVLHENEQLRLAYITAVDSKRNAKLRVVKIEKWKEDIRKGFAAYKIELLNTIPSNGKTVVAVEYHLTEYLEPYPTKITQAESQFVIYKGNAHIPSIYSLTHETTIIVLPNGKLESHTTVSPTKVESGKITYGPYSNQKPYIEEEILVHVENNSPFVVATDIVRLIEVSHWGNIAVEESISVVHKGAMLKGPFSRLDFQMDRRGSKRPVVTQYRTLLPASAKDIYYRDEIGNISTSAVRKMTDAVELVIQPRFPLFGGWKTDYVLGYNVPAYQYLYSSGNKFALKMRIIDHLFDNAVIEHMKLKIILPEGSKNFKLTTPFPVKRGPDELHFTYLDVTGRPVIVVEKDNLVDAHIQMFTDIATESRLQVQGQVEQLADLHADRLKIYDQFTDAANKYKNSKDTASFTTARKKAENDLKNVGQSIGDLQAELKPANADISEKAERMVKGQLSKAAFTEAEKAYTQKLNEAKEKMDAIIYAL